MLFALYIVGGILGAMIVALVLAARTVTTRARTSGFMMEMPKYQMPGWRDVVLGLWQRALIFLKRAGTIILVSNLALWALVFFPRPPAGYDKPAIDYSIAGRVANAIEPVFRPIGFNRDIVLALIPAMAAREVAVSALATVYAPANRARCLLAQPGAPPANEGKNRACAGSLRQSLAVADRARLPRLVRVRAAVPVDPGGGAARDQWLALAGFYARLSVRTGIPRIRRYILGSESIRALATQIERRGKRWQAASTR